MLLLSPGVRDQINTSFSQAVARELGDAPLYQQILNAETGGSIFSLINRDPDVFAGRPKDRLYPRKDPVTGDYIVGINHNIGKSRAALERAQGGMSYTEALQQMKADVDRASRQSDRYIRDNGLQDLPAEIGNLMTSLHYSYGPEAIQDLDIGDSLRRGDFGQVAAVLGGSEADPSQYANSRPALTEQYRDSFQSLSVGLQPTERIPTGPQGTGTRVLDQTRDQIENFQSVPGGRFVSNDFNAFDNGDGPIATGHLIVLPEDATPEEFTAANQYLERLNTFFEDRGVTPRNRGILQQGVNTDRGVPGVIHVEPFFAQDSEAREAIESDPQAYALLTQETLGSLPGTTFIPPHRSTDGGAETPEGFNERDWFRENLLPSFTSVAQSQPTESVEIPASSTRQSIPDLGTVETPEITAQDFQQIGSPGQARLSDNGGVVPDLVQPQGAPGFDFNAVGINGSGRAPVAVGTADSGAGFNTNSPIATPVDSLANLQANISEPTPVGPTYDQAITRGLPPTAPPIPRDFSPGIDEGPVQPENFRPGIDEGPVRPDTRPTELNPVLSEIIQNNEINRGLPEATRPPSAEPPSDASPGFIETIANSAPVQRLRRQFTPQGPNIISALEGVDNVGIPEIIGATAATLRDRESIGPQGLSDIAQANQVIGDGLRNLDQIVGSPNVDLVDLLPDNYIENQRRVAQQRDLEILRAEVQASQDNTGLVNRFRNVFDPEGQALRRIQLEEELRQLEAATAPSAPIPQLSNLPIPEVQQGIVEPQVALDPATGLPILVNQPVSPVPQLSNLPIPEVQQAVVEPTPLASINNDAPSTPGTFRDILQQQNAELDARIAESRENIRLSQEAITDQIVDERNDIRPDVLRIRDDINELRLAGEQENIRRNTENIQNARTTAAQRARSNALANAEEFIPTVREGQDQTTRAITGLLSGNDDANAALGALIRPSETPFNSLAAAANIENRNVLLQNANTRADQLQVDFDNSQALFNDPRAIAARQLADNTAAISRFNTAASQDGSPTASNSIFATEEEFRNQLARGEIQSLQNTLLSREERRLRDLIQQRETQNVNRLVSDQQFQQLVDTAILSGRGGR